MHFVSVWEFVGYEAGRASFLSTASVSASIHANADSLKSNSRSIHKSLGCHFFFIISTIHSVLLNEFLAAT